MKIYQAASLLIISNIGKVKADTLTKDDWIDYIYYANEYATVSSLINFDDFVASDQFTKYYNRTSEFEALLKQQIAAGTETSESITVKEDIIFAVEQFEFAANSDAFKDQEHYYDSLEETLKERNDDSYDST